MVAAATLAKYANANVDLFVELYRDKYGKAPVVNRHRIKWAFQDMIKDLGGRAEAERVIRYYFGTKKVGHPVEHLLYNYERMHQIILDTEADKENRLVLRKETEKRVKEWEERYGNN